jgi:uncharacterized protein (DUF1778 family)
MRVAEGKTKAMTLRVTPDFKRLVDEAARLEKRSRTNLIEKLVLDHCRTVGLATPATARPVLEQEATPAPEN